MTSSGDKTLDVVGVGSWTNFDHIFVVDHLPEPGDTVQITGAIDSVEQIFFGGCAPNNVAVTAQLGGRSGLVGVAGEDFQTRGYQAYFENLGVDLRGLQIVEGAHCGHSFLYADPDGNSICISHLGVAAQQEKFEPSANVLRQAKVAVINYRFDRYTLKAAELVRESGGTVVVSGATMTGPDSAEAFSYLTDYLICTEHELQQLIGFLGIVGRDALFDRGLRAIVTTRGKRGSQIVTRYAITDIPIASARHVVDPTGAGDGFTGGVAFGLARSLPLADSCRLGAVVASFVVEARGCQTNLPTYAQVEARYFEAFGVPLAS